MPRIVTSGFAFLLLVALMGRSRAFQVRPLHSVQRFNTALGPVIKSEEVDFDFDVGQGGVRLAQESAIVVSGTVKHKPGSAKAQTKSLTRYTEVTELQEPKVQEQLQKLGATVICTGEGQEDYKDPGETLEELVVLAPLDAVRDALNSAGSAMSADTIVINILGGDDLQTLEALAAAETMVLDLDIATKAKVKFHSMCHSSFPLERASITVVGLPEEASAGGLLPEERSIAQGRVYSMDGKWWTVVEGNINEADE